MIVPLKINVSISLTTMVRKSVVNSVLLFSHKYFFFKYLTDFFFFFNCKLQTDLGYDGNSIFRNILQNEQSSD